MSQEPFRNKEGRAPRRLGESLNSRYLEAANTLNAHRRKRRIVAYVESYQDIFFWRAVLSEFENEEFFFEVMLPSRVNVLQRGKKAVLMQLLMHNVGPDMIACVDADYDYLMQGRSPQSATLLNNPYIFHTYVYAIENLQCYAPALHNICVAVTLNDKHFFDFETFLSAYSTIIYPLFVWNVLAYRQGWYQSFSMTDMSRIIAIGKPHLKEWKVILDKLAKRVDSSVRRLEKEYPQKCEECKKMAAELAHLGITPAYTYLYIQGHHLYDNVVMPLLKTVCNKLIQDREREIERQSKHGTQRKNELAGYQHSVDEIEAMIRKTTGYQKAEPYRRIQTDIAQYLDLQKQYNSQNKDI